MNMYKFVNSLFSRPFKNILTYFEPDKKKIIFASGMNKCGFVTGPHPGFPTDLQAPAMALLSLVPGKSIITETVFDNRFQHVSELQKMGCLIIVEGNTVKVERISHLKGCSTLAVTDIRAGACLVLAALAAKGNSLIHDSNGHINRGYSNMVEKLRGCGANIAAV